MARRYSNCYFCGGKVSERKVTVDYRWGDDFLAIIKNVPAGVCTVCGEQYFKAEVVKAMERTAHSKTRPRKTQTIPVRELKVA
ncbi:MAG: type II toxin-antitoxin system MqsA family antitoxin [Acidobacteria bacterium]|nr:type II toxin-antitoxin system MqsA family antitoxin [Acidobacteriota bacterium]